MGRIPSGGTIRSARAWSSSGRKLISGQNAVVLAQADDAPNPAERGLSVQDENGGSFR